MDDIFDDESTDDEFGVNLQLAERLCINRGEHNTQEAVFENSKEFKQYCNMRRKEECTHGGGNSSSSFDIFNDSTIPETPSPYLIPNKKRQNGDKNQEHLANPKRTCLSDRFHKSSDWHENKKKLGHTDGRYSCKVSESKFSYPERHVAERDLSPDKTYESHLNNSTHLHDLDDSDSDSDLTFPKRGYKNGTFPKSRIFRNTLSLPSSSASGVCTNPYEIRSSSSRGVQFIESDSDESTKSAVQNGALKGGRQSPDYVHFNKKVVGRRNKKVLDSDETEDESWQVGYRSRPICFSSSESEDSMETNIKKNHTNGIAKVAADHSFPYSEETCLPSDKRACNSLQTFKPSSFGGDNTNSQVLAASAAGCPFAAKGFRNRALERSCRTRQSSRNGLAAPNFPEVNFLPSISSPGSPLRGRNRMIRGERHSRRPGSPHPRVIRSQRHTEATRSSARRLINASRAESGTLDLISTYPDLFDAEDSSEVEFFTANSYSDTETSNESLGGLTINATFVNHPDPRNNTEIDCKHSANVGSSEDEISVVFSTAPHSRNSEQRRGSARAIGRRYSRGAARSHIQSAQEVVSLSPDPVEQVRQMEEDERFARMLQAQFDAEVDPDFTPRSLNASFPLLPSSADSEDEIIDPVGESDSDRLTPPPIIQSSQRPPSIRRGHRIGHYNARTRVPPFSPSGFLLFNSRRPRNRSRNRRRLSSGMHTDPWMWQFARIFGLSPSIASSMSSMSSIDDSIENDYETLIELAEANGEAVQRGLLRTEINRLPTRKYINPNSASSSNYASEVTHKRTELNKECQVCLSDYETGDLLRILPCFHEFHTPCIDPWLKINHTCPVCRVIVDLGD